MIKRTYLLPVFIAIIIAFALINPIAAQAETIYVVANTNVSDSALTQSDLQKIYLGKRDKWNDNQGINFTALSSGPCHEAFIKKYVKKSTFQFQNYWKKQIFTGKGQPPRGFNSDAELVDYVSRTSGAIGFSCTQPASGKVKVLTIN